MSSFLFCIFTLSSSPGQVCFSCLLFLFLTIQDVLMTIRDLSDFVSLNKVR